MREKERAREREQLHVSFRTVLTRCNVMWFLWSAYVCERLRCVSACAFMCAYVHVTYRPTQTQLQSWPTVNVEVAVNVMRTLVCAHACTHTYLSQLVCVHACTCTYAHVHAFALGGPESQSHEKRALIGSPLWPILCVRTGTLLRPPTRTFHSRARDDSLVHGKE